MQVTETINNRYRILRHIGAGGMGVVYQAYDRLNNQIVALKQIAIPDTPSSYSSEQNTNSFRLGLAQEFQTLASLRHPNIINVLDYGFDKDRHPYFTMEYLENAQTITDYARQVNVEDKAKLLLQTLEALAYLHRRGILHRDLKPDNVVVINHQVKVLDFGLAITYQHQKQENNAVGTLAYMAPEVLQGMEASPQSDLYAVGMIAYEMFAGSYPFNTAFIQPLIVDIVTKIPDVTLLDVSVELQTLITQLIDKSPVNRYHNAELVIQDLNKCPEAPLDYEIELIQESYLQAAAFVGRDDELGQLQHALMKTIQGKGSGWLIGGESGVGKSRLMEELRIHALVQGVMVLRGRGSAEGGMPYEFWREPIRRLILSSQIDDIQASVLKEIVPDIDQLLERPIATIVEIDAKLNRQRLIGAIHNLFNQQSQPILLLLDDLQWANESLEILQTFNNYTNLMIVGNYRIDEVPDLPSRLPNMHHIKLNRLNYDAINQLAESILGKHDYQKPVVEILKRESEGNIYFIIEIIRELIDEAGSLRHVGQVTIPSGLLGGGIKRLLQKRLERVPEYAQTYLKLAAVYGRQIDTQVLLTVNPDIDTENWLTMCANAAVLEFIDENWLFSHDKLRDAIVEEIPPEELTVIHLKLATALEALYADDPAYAPALARHWGGAGNIRKECHYLQIAGRTQLKICAYRDAIRSFERLEMIAPSIKEKTLAQTYLGAAFIGISDYVNARHVLLTALDNLEQSDIPEEILQQLAILEIRIGNYIAAQEYFKHSIEYAKRSNNQKSICDSLSHLGELATNVGVLDQAKDYLDQCMLLAEKINAPGTLALALRNMSKLCYQKKDYAKGKSYIYRALEIARQIGDRYSMARSYNALGVFSATIGDYEDAIQQYKASLQHFKEIGDRWGEGIIMNNLGFVHVLMGNYLDAATVFFEALKILRTIDAIPVTLEVFVGLARVFVEINRENTALHLIGLAVNHPSTIEDVRTLSQHAYKVLEARLVPEVIEKELAYGKTLDMHAVVDQLLAEHEIILAALQR
ncbi:MAG: hypothetical protein Kow00117_07640 [Phototrophicales bacterium]